jgi:hypothetical protein
MAGNSSPPSSTSPEQPNGSLRLSTVPGPDRVLPAAHRELRLGTLVIPLRQHMSPHIPLGGGPAKDMGLPASSLASCSRRVPASRHIPNYLLCSSLNSACVEAVRCARRSSCPAHRRAIGSVLTIETGSLFSIGTKLANIRRILRFFALSRRGCALQIGTKTCAFLTS